MTPVAVVKVPLLSVTSPMQGQVLAVTEGNINGIPLRVTVSASEIYIAWADRSGPAFVVELNPLIKAAVNEIEALLGMGQGMRK
jgi:hypothetical protein